LLFMATFAFMFGVHAEDQQNEALFLKRRMRSFSLYIGGVVFCIYVAIEVSGASFSIAGTVVACLMLVLIW